MDVHKDKLVSIGKAYDTDVTVPFWFKHFGNPGNGGAGDAYHIGVFGRTGSGKTTTAANIMLGYARHSEHMSMLILDPQEQFYEDINVLPGGKKFEEAIKETGMSYKKYRVPEDVALPDDAVLFSELLLDYGFIKHAFDILTPQKCGEMREAIQRYIGTRMDFGGFKISQNPDKALNDLLRYFLNVDDRKEREPLKRVYSQNNRIAEVKESIEDTISNGIRAKEIWNNVCVLFSEKNKIPLEGIIKEVVCKPKNTIVLNISGKSAQRGMDNLQTLFIKIIEDAVKEKGAELYSQGKKANCLVVLDEAHRYMNTYSYNDEIKELTTSIIDAVRTTRKYGIGYMFITQSIESLHEEIRQQIRIFAFGYRTY